MVSVAATAPRRHGETEGARATLRLGVVSYLNAAPLVYGLDRDPRFLLSLDVPSKVADLLHRGEVDLGMIPAIEYAVGDYELVPGVAMGSRGPVRSVNLYHPGPIESVRRVAVDVSSRTSVALLKVLLRERLGRDPEYVVLPPSVPRMLEVADAALVIGDRALYFEGQFEDGIERLDLGAEWHRLTGLPFVFAFWAGPAGVLTKDDVLRLQRALAEGLAATSEIAARYNPSGDGFTVPEGVDYASVNESYLRSNIVYAFGEAEVEGLREFYRRAHAIGLIPQVPELKFHGYR